MADQDLREAFNDCIDRLAAGQNIGDCLRAYPQYARELEPLLETGALVERAQATPYEVSAAQTRVRARVNAQLHAPRTTPNAYGRLTALVASLLVVFVAVLLAAETSLPGDPLYNVKRFSEGVRSSLIGEQFGGRRLDEIRALEALKRPEPVEFSGQVEQIEGEQWRISGLDIQVAAGTPGADAATVGSKVQVSGYTTDQGALIATALTPIKPPDTTPILTETITPPPSRTPTPTPTSTPTPQPTICAPTLPSGWVNYVIQPGDTVAGLAAATGTTTDQLIAANCLPENQRIIAGQTIYLPMNLLPAATVAPIIATDSPTVESSAPATAQSTDDHGHDSGEDDSSHSGETEGDG